MLVYILPCLCAYLFEVQHYQIAMLNSIVIVVVLGFIFISMKIQLTNINIQDININENFEHVCVRYGIQELHLNFW